MKVRDIAMMEGGEAIDWIESNQDMEIISAEELTSLREQVEEKESRFRKLFSGWKNAIRCQNKAIRRRNKHIRSLQKQVEELSKYPEDLYLEVYSAIAHGLSDCEDVKEVDVDMATENAMKVVSRFAQYPEEAVRAVYEYAVETCVGLTFHRKVTDYDGNKDKLAAIFKEKQGAGK